MARHNFVNVIAFVHKEPAFKDGVDGRSGIIGMGTIMSPREKFKSTSGYQCRNVYFNMRSQEPAMVKAIGELKLNDVVEVNGFLATKEKDKSKDITECPFCGRKMTLGEALTGEKRSNGTMVFVYPISIRLLEHCETEEKAHLFLNENHEDVNRVFLMGNLCSSPVQGTYQGGVKNYTRYQLAINRKYRPKGGTELYDRTDYPWVYTYQDKAKEDFINLDKGALVFVDGALQSRKYKEQAKCVYCGKDFDSHGKTLEVLSYDTEYLRIPPNDSDENEEQKT